MIPACTPSSGTGRRRWSSPATPRSRAGAAPPPRRPSASSSVRRTWLAVTSRWRATTSSPVPGTSPWTAATVVVPSRSTSKGTRTGSDGDDRQPGHAPATAPARVDAACEQQPGQRRTGEGDEQAHAGHPDPRQRVGPRRVGGGEGEATEGHPAEGEAAAPRLDPDPPQGRPDRPRACRQAHASPRPSGDEERRLEGAHRDPRVGADRAHPHHDGVGEGDAEEQASAARPGRAAGRAREHQRGDRRRHQPREADRLEGRRQHESADEGDEAAERHGADRSRRTLEQAPAGCGRNAAASDQRATAWLTITRSCLRPRGPSRIQPPRGASTRSPDGGHRWLRVPHVRPPTAEGATHGLHRRTRNHPSRAARLSTRA